MNRTKRKFLVVVFTVTLSLLITAGTSATQSSVKSKVAVKEAGSSRTFEEILTNEGFSRNDVYKLLQDPAVPEKMHLNAKDRYLVVKTFDPVPRTEVRLYPDYSGDALVFWHENKDKGSSISGVSRQNIEFKVVKKKVEGSVHGSLVESIKAQLGDDWPAYRFLDAFYWDLNLEKQLIRDDSYKFTIEEKYDQGKFVRYGEILDAELKTQGVVLKRALWQSGATKVFIDPQSKFATRPFYAPVDYVHISSPYNKHRLHPVKHNYQPHLGVDFALNEGSPVYAAWDGEVVEAGRHHGNGNFVTLKHDGDYFTIYSHLESWAPHLAAGAKVVAGQIIGYVGCTGYCTSPHLDFRIRKGTKLFNPVYLIKPFPFKVRDYWTTTKFKELLGVKVTTQN